MYIGLYIKYRYSCQILMKLEVSRHIFEKFSNIKLYINPPIGSRVAPCGRTYITKLIVVSRNYANAPNHLPKHSNFKLSIINSVHCFRYHSFTPTYSIHHLPTQHTPIHVTSISIDHVKTTHLCTRQHVL